MLLGTVVKISCDAVKSFAKMYGFCYYIDADTLEFHFVKKILSIKIGLTTPTIFPRFLAL